MTLQFRILSGITSFFSIELFTYSISLQSSGFEGDGKISISIFPKNPAWISEGLKIECISSCKSPLRGVLSIEVPHPQDLEEDLILDIPFQNLQQLKAASHRALSSLSPFFEAIDAGSELLFISEWQKFSREIFPEIVPEPKKIEISIDYSRP